MSCRRSESMIILDKVHIRRGVRPPVHGPRARCFLKPSPSQARNTYYRHLGSPGATGKELELNSGSPHVRAQAAEMKSTLLKGSNTRGSFKFSLIRDANLLLDASGSHNLLTNANSDPFSSLASSQPLGPKAESPSLPRVIACCPQDPA
ncbi:hypothetical protein C8F01DRAFT_1081569 [Mycena amicta]|nr:hypothetical protein C8F01DRAFT_1081569 [Mycena amicta]